MIQLPGVILNPSQPLSDAKPFSLEAGGGEEYGSFRLRQDRVEISPEARAAARYLATGETPSSPLDRIDSFFDLTNRQAGQLFQMPHALDSAEMGATLKNMATLLQRGVIGYEIREYPDNQPHVSFISNNVAPGGPYGRPYPPGYFRDRTL